VQQTLMTFAVFSLCPASSVLLSAAGKIKADSETKVEYLLSNADAAFVIFSIPVVIKRF